MKAGTPSFTENDTAGGVFKGSLFKSLFRDRKAILEGYPAVKKGLSFPEPSREVCYLLGRFVICCQHLLFVRKVVEEELIKHKIAEETSLSNKNESLHPSKKN